ncbi:hypothetical protein G6011_11783 [Alternaria panax]|uniref:Uncharacterized protein n=1 Tax=Alternaria panax TaxID=48097 RepID=A0AAD4FA64_9PLEO|nr:hypothetical protein G6011_11783 [Alternaria panax]
MAKDNPRRSDRKKVAPSHTLAVSRMIRSTDKYGFQILIPDTDTTAEPMRRSGTKANAEPHSPPIARPIEDAPIDDTPHAPAVEPNNEFIEGSVLGKRSRSDSSDEVDGGNMRGETDTSRDDVLYVSTEEHPKSSEENGALHDMNREETVRQKSQSSVDKDVELEDIAITPNSARL